MRCVLSFFVLLLSQPAAAQFDTPLIPASGGYSETIKAVDISGDVAVIATNGSTADEDTVYVFRRTGSNWLPDTAFVPPNAQAVFGVAVHGDRIIVGDIWNGTFGVNAGAAFVYDYKNGTWMHTATFGGLDTDDFDQFGAAVGLTDSLAVIGAASGHPSGVDGAVYVFRLQTDNSYAQEAKLFPELAFFDGSFGENLAVSGDRVVTGQPTGKPGFPEAAYYYVRSGAPSDPSGGWVLEDTTAAPPSQPDIGYGFRVALSGDLALVLGGETFAYKRQGQEWIEEALLSTELAASVALTGSVAIIGVETSDEAGDNAGALYLFERNNFGNWSFLAVLTASDAVPGDLLGDEVAVDEMLVITHGTRKAWVFDLSAIVAAEPTSPAEVLALSVYPNPVRVQADVQYFVPQAGRVRITLHDLLGRKLAELDDMDRVSGLYRVRLETNSLAAGVYVVRLTFAGSANSVLFTVIH